MRSPGRAVAEWIADDPNRLTGDEDRDRIGRALDLGFYTALVNLGCAIIAVGILVGIINALV